MMRPLTKDHHDAITLVEEIFNRRMSPTAYQMLCEASIILGVSALREREGDEFVRGFLDAALQSLNEPNSFSVKPVERH